MYAQHADYRRCGPRTGEVAGANEATKAVQPKNFVVKQSARTSANLPSAADTGRKSLSRNFSRVEDALIQAEILCAGLSLLELLHLNPLKSDKSNLLPP